MDLEPKWSLHRPIRPNRPLYSLLVSVGLGKLPLGRLKNPDMTATRQHFEGRGADIPYWVSSRMRDTLRGFVVHK